ncbi:MAG TPA: trypsin-like peptidase domain-containing protein, partial [Nocardioidaceae bacterium]|nr:trypsin-like peptidase domain-containing protein [Nocardioidaceae bacterium]
MGIAPAAAANAAVTPKTEAPNEARALSRAFSNVAKALGPSVVRIEVEVARGGGGNGNGGGRRRMPAPNGPDDDDDEVPPFFRHFFEFGPGGGMPEPGPAHGVGSGFIIGTNGDIITNRHVVQGATKVTVTMNDGKEYPAHVVGKDAQTDVAVVRMEKPPANLVVARLGDSDKLEVGEWVVAVGSPLGLEQTVTAGIVSGKGRPGRHVQMSGKRVRGYIQTDAKINPGNSGGPLVNLEGEVVGVNTLIQVGAGGAYGFAIPVNEVRRVAQLLVKEGRVRYPYLGLLLTDVKDLDDTQKAKLGKQLPQRGAFVQELTPGGPAGKAGMRPGDVITEVNAQKINGAGDVVDYVSGQNIGTKVTVTMNDGKEYPAQVVGKDAQTDVAVVRMEKPPANLVVARLGDSDKLEVGEWVVAVGSPLGLEQTVTAGIVSGKGRPGRHVQMSGKRVRGYIQTDAKINPGNSGGPLVNLEGEVVGVNTLIQVGAGGAYGFAIPVNEVRRVATLLVKEGRVRYPYLGLLLTDVKDLDEAQKAKLAKPVPAQGAVVQELTPGGPAGKAGMRPGDVITEVNNQK